VRKKLKKNIIRCKHCEDVIESKSQHDFKRCICGKVAVDGGLVYGKRSFPSYPAEEHFDDLSEYE
jgi:hypothetical protein